MIAPHAAEKWRQQLEARDKMGGGASAAAVNDDGALRWKKEDKGAMLARLTFLPGENTEARTTQLEELGRAPNWLLVSTVRMWGKADEYPCKCIELRLNDGLQRRECLSTVD